MTTRRIAIAAGSLVALYLVYSHLQSFSDVSFLSGIVLLEIIAACLWRYEQRFFVLLMLTFVLAGLHVPVQSLGTVARWVVLAAGTVVGLVLWTKSPRRPSGAMHLLGLFCVCAAFVSATVSQYTQMASLKALSLLLLFLYCSTGVRLAALGREDRFFRGLLIAAQIGVYLTAILYLGLGQSVWGNPNSLGAAMSLMAFPILLWGWFIADAPRDKLLRLIALLLCAYLTVFSMARAAMLSAAVVTLVFCLCLRQYKLLVKAAVSGLAIVAVTGLFAPAALSDRVGDIKDALLYKGHKEQGALSSRRSPWEKTLAEIRQHPLFGTGYGTSPTGEDPGLDLGPFASTAETEREHGSGYLTILEWVGVVGVLPFAALLVMTAINAGRVCSWIARNSHPRHYSIPLALVVLSGLIHTSFEDWLFAVGSYPCVYFWVCAFLLADFVPARAVARLGTATPGRFPANSPRTLRPLPAALNFTLPSR